MEHLESLAQRGRTTFLLGIQPLLRVTGLSVQGGGPSGSRPNTFPSAWPRRPPSPLLQPDPSPSERRPSSRHATQTHSGHETRRVSALPTHTVLFRPRPCFFPFTPVAAHFLICHFVSRHILIPPSCLCRSACVSPNPRSSAPSCTCSPNPISQPSQDCPCLNGKGILREIVVGNNKPTRNKSQVDIQSFKVQLDRGSEIH